MLERIVIIISVNSQTRWANVGCKVKGTIRKESSEPSSEENGEDWDSGRSASTYIYIGILGDFYIITILDMFSVLT